jgi:hypothetical protein
LPEGGSGGAAVNRRAYQAFYSHSRSQIYYKSPFYGKTVIPQSTLKIKNYF